MRRVAVVLMNLGGPDRPESVQPFLFNLFNDPAIISLPGILRWPLAKFISSRRAPVAKEIYRELGGGSPLLANTEAQATKLQDALNDAANDDGAVFEVFIAMRYWHPLSEECAREVRDFDPEMVVLLPLYPQFSTTTSASSVGAFRGAAKAVGLESEERVVCCYASESGFVEGVAQLTEAAILAACAAEEQNGSVEKGVSSSRLLFSAHGLPKKIVERGDPYQWQVEKSVQAVVERLQELRPEWTDIDYVVCYQSRVGPLEWIGPSTDDEIVRSGQDGKSVILVPIAFVSEHSETLVELDIEYRRLAEAHAVPAYHRVPTVGTSPAFIDGLAKLVMASVQGEASVRSEEGTRVCPRAWSRCRYQLEA